MPKFPERRREQARIEIIPMIDVMMFLLVFFVLISINVLPATGQKVALPGSAAPAKIVEPKRVTVTITKDGVFELDGQPLPLDRLTGELRGKQTPDTPLAVVINGDQGAVLQNLVDVLDALKAAGVTNASIVSKAR
jgi:biopolymer transport protein ExbD